MDRSAYDRFRSDEDPQEPDESAFRMGAGCRAQGGSLDDNPFKEPFWLWQSWRAGWCDVDQSLLSKDG